MFIPSTETAVLFFPFPNIQGSTYLLEKTSCLSACLLLLLVHFYSFMDGQATEADFTGPKKKTLCKRKKNYYSHDSRSQFSEFYWP